MSEAVTSTSLITVCLNRESLNKVAPAEGAQASFQSVFTFDFDDTSNPGPSLIPISSEAAGPSALNRLLFFAEPASLPFLIAPLLLHAVWNLESVGSVVFRYQSIPDERLFAARAMLESGCEAVLLRSDDQPPIVLGLARTVRTERLLDHWVDCVSQIHENVRLHREDLHPGLESDDLFGGRLIEHLCDRIGSLRLAESRSLPAFRPSAQSMPAIVRSAIETLLPESELLMEDPIGNAAGVLNSPAPGLPQDPQNLISRLMTFIWSTRPDLKKVFDLSISGGRQDFVDWFLERAESELGVGVEYTSPVQIARANHIDVPEAVDSPAGDPDSSVDKSIEESLDESAGKPDLAFGVNLIGYPRAEMGMGEQLRSCAAALETANFPFGITDFQQGLIASNRDVRYERLISPDNPFPINLFHVNADQIGLAREKLGPSFFRDHYNIGYWEWELSNFPDEWLQAIDLMDEIWAPSKFVAEAVSKKTSKPVIWMPLAIEFPTAPGSHTPASSRAKFKLPENDFLFLFPFDFSSFSTRKNYRACIDAFRRAFADSGPVVGGPNAGLVLKTICHAHQRREFWDFLRSVGDDQRIYVIDRVLRNQEMRELISSCDSLVSLHRSEGFGLGIAEAMYLGKPVIVTNYSGNRDFTCSGNSCLVDYKLVPVKPGEYTFPEGQVWADPDIGQAAAYMRRLVEEIEYGNQLGRAAAKSIRRQLNPKIIGARYAKRLKQILSARDLLAASGRWADYLEETSLDSRPSLIGKFVERLF